MKFQIMILFIAVLSALNVVAQEGDKKIGDPIDVTDEKAIEASIGKTVLIKGNVTRSDSSPQTADIRIWFSYS